MRRDLLLLCLGAALLFVPWLGARDLWNPNEPLYGQAVAEMAAAGEWLIPSVNGATFDEKPILYFWLALAASKLAGGVDETTLRLPTACAGVVATGLVYLLVLPYVGRRRALVAGGLLATTFVVFWSARQVQMDLLLATCTLGALLGGVRALDGPWRPTSGWLVAGASAGLGFLAKGPVGLILPALVVASYAATTGRVAALARAAVWVGVAAFLTVASPWYLLLWAAGQREFLAEVLLRQNLLRFVEAWDHQAPWWYYLRYFWIDMAPWAWFVPLAWGLGATEESERRLQRMAWIWIAVVVVFFSLSASKRSPYILPVAPAVAILVSGLFDRAVAGWRRVGIRLLQAIVGGLLLSAGIALAVRSPWVVDGGPEIAQATRVMIVAFVVSGGICLGAVATLRRRPALSVGAMLLSLALIYLAAAAAGLPAADRFKSPRPLCEAIRSHVAPQQPLRGFFEWEWRSSYSFYTGRAIPNLGTLEELRAYWARDERVFVLVERGKLDEARRVLGEIEPLEARAVGSNFAYLFSNRADGAIYGE